MLMATPMAYKTNAPAQALAGFEALAVEGPQAGAFLQAQTMNDVLALGVGEWQWNGWLDARGRVHALFALLRTAEDAYLLVLPDVPAATLRDALARFVFRTKVALRVADELVCAARWDDDAPRPAGSEAHVAVAQGEDAWALDWSGEGIRRALWVLRRGDARAVAASAAGDARWRDADLRLGLPRLGEAQLGTWTPQMLSLQRLRAFSLKKGCFPGQEIVARTHYLGQAKRELALLHADGGLVPGAGVTRATGTSAGTLVSASDDGRLALAVLSTDAADAALQCAGAPATRLALVPGLQRPA
jgi:folate-binding protein YgfZ